MNNLSLHSWVASDPYLAGLVLETIGQDYRIAEPNPAKLDPADYAEKMERRKEILDGVAKGRAAAADLDRLDDIAADLRFLRDEVVGPMVFRLQIISKFGDARLAEIQEIIRRHLADDLDLVEGKP